MQTTWLFFSFVMPQNAGSYYLTPSQARWATATGILPSTLWRPDIHLQILESLCHRCRFKIGKVVEHSQELLPSVLWNDYTTDRRVFQVPFLAIVKKI